MTKRSATWSPAEWAQWREVFELYGRPAAQRPRQDLDDATWGRLLEQRRAAPERNPLLRPRSGEVDPLPPHIRAALREMCDCFAPMTQEDRDWHTRNHCRNLGAQLAEGRALSTKDQAWLAEALTRIGAGMKPHNALFGRKLPGAVPRASTTLIRRLVRLIWHNPKRVLKPEYATAGYALVTDGQPPWLAPSQAVAFQWVGELLGLHPDNVKKQYRLKTERHALRVPVALIEREIQQDR